VASSVVGDLPSSQIAAVLVEPGRIELSERPVPRPGPKEVVLEVRAVGLCGSDAHYYREGRIGDFVVRAPLVLGHEASGRVVARGPDCRLELDQRVAIEPGVPCRVCWACKSGHYNLCPDVSFMATPPVDGALCQYVLMPEDFCHPVPDSLSDEAAALIEPTAVAVWASDKAALRPGETVAVIGAGPVGCLCGLVGLAGGARPLLVDVEPRRIERARRLGLDAREASELEGSQFDAALECSGAEGALDLALEISRPAGRVVAVGMSAESKVAISLSALQTKEIWLTGTFRYANVYPRAIDLAARGLVPLDNLVDDVMGLNRTAEGLELPRRNPSVLKVVVRPNQAA
jgi:L-iditol 2-dehydrogenase